jgi:hypothetical protein
MGATIPARPADACHDRARRAASAANRDRQACAGGFARRQGVLLRPSNTKMSDRSSLSTTIDPSAVTAYSPVHERSGDDAG